MWTRRAVLKTGALATLAGPLTATAKGGNTVKTHLRRADARGHADHGWLDTRHTFSFAGYDDPRFMGFGDLRVISEDHIAAGAGFPKHPHRDMEIVSYVVEGALAHADTLGTGSVIRPGEVQLMSAGRGIAHSEYNHSKDEGVHLLQIWARPAERGTAPRYDQKAFPTTEKGLRLVVSPDGRDGSLTVGQDMDLHRLLLEGDDTATLAPRRGRVWVQVVKGGLEVAGERLASGDGLAIVEPEALTFRAHGGTEALVFDLR
jgi:redox-sensitive bicupin YhaK (pirin superfamily)